MIKKRSMTLLVILLMVLLVPGSFVKGEKEQEVKLRPIGLQDSLAWKSIRSTVVSNDGSWLAYQLSPNKGNSEVIIKQSKGKKEFRFGVGKAPRYSRKSTIAFSENTKWIAFIIYPKDKEVKKLKKQKKKLYNRVGLVNLRDGKKKEFEKMKGFSFSGENPGWIALHRYPSESKGKKKWSGSDLILRQLATSSQLNIGNVSEYAFDKKGRWLAWIVDADEKNGNGLQLRSMTIGTVVALDSGEYNYKRLKWTEKGDGLAVLRGKEDKKYKDKLYSLLGFSGFKQKQRQKVAYNPEEDKSFPEGMTISPNRDPLWADDFSGILFGIHKVEKKEDGKQKKKKKEEDKKDQKKTKEDKPDKVDKEDIPGLVIWHWLDKRLQSMQQVQEKRDKNFSYLAIFRVKEKKLIRLADEKLRDVRSAPKHRFAIGLDDLPYRLVGNLDGRRYRDIYVVNLKSGKRLMAIKGCRWYFGASHEGTHFLYYKDGHFYTYDMVNNRSHNITRQVPTSFVNQESDVNVKKPPVRPFGWIKGGKSVLLYDNWDVWRVPVHGGKGINLTVKGKKEQIRFRQRFILDPEEKGINLSDAVYFFAYGEWTKKSGIARIDKGKPGVRMLLWDDAHFSQLKKAKKSNTYFYTRQTYKDYPDVYVTDAMLRNGRRITHANTQQKEFLWSSGVRLIDYTSDQGKKLQAALFLPANYQEGKRYPTIVYIYEKLSLWMHRYFTPSARGFNKSVYTSCGYAVLMPDIVYKINDPGMSAVWCVLPAIKAAVAEGVVDEKKVGIHGHSWGGYQTAFLITQTELFKAAIAGAPLTNMISMYSSIYWNSGSANQPIFESSQGRFTGGYWENIEAYTRNSPVYFANKVKTPLIILHNDKDGAVDWNQGIEYFNTLRRLKKPVVMLQYKGENHGLRKSPNQIDYTIRMREFFDHHLLGKPAPQWLKEGISHLKLKKHITKRVKKWQKKKSKPKEKEEKKRKKKIKKLV